MSILIKLILRSNNLLIRAKNMFSKSKLLIVTVITIIVAVIGCFKILVNSKGHVEFWSAIGSWIGGLATLYAVCIAILEYLNRKRLDGAYEILDFADLVGDQLFVTWTELCIRQLVSNSIRELYENNKSVESYEESYVNSLEKLKGTYSEFYKPLNRFSFYAFRVKFISPKKYEEIKSEVLVLNKFLSDFNDLEKLTYFVHGTKFNIKFSSEFKSLSDKISKKSYKGSVLMIQKDKDWNDYMETVSNTVFIPLLTKLRTIN